MKRTAGAELKRAKAVLQREKKTHQQTENARQAAEVIRQQAEQSRKLAQQASNVHVEASVLRINCQINTVQEQLDHTRLANNHYKTILFPTLTFEHSEIQKADPCGGIINVGPGYPQVSGLFDRIYLDTKQTLSELIAGGQGPTSIQQICDVLSNDVCS